VVMSCGVSRHCKVRFYKYKFALLHCWFQNFLMPRPSQAKSPAKSGKKAVRAASAEKGKRKERKAKTKKQLTVDGTPFRFVTAKLYGEDADKADWVAEHANLTDLVTSSVRLIHGTLQKFFNHTLPDYYSTPRLKLRRMDETHSLMVDVQTGVYQQYIEADRLIRQKLGHSLGAEFLMSLAIQRSNPAELAQEYLSALSEEEPAETGGGAAGGK
jgi:hypothetical protein